MNKLLALLEMLVCLAGINVCFGLWSVKQERIVKFPYAVTRPEAGTSTKQDFFTTTFLIGLSQTVAGLVVGLVVLAVQKLVQACRRRREAASQDVVPPLGAKDVRQILSMGFTNAFGTSLGYAAMRRLPYPVALAAKLAKMVPVMVVGFVWYGTRYPAKKVASCLLLTAGVMSFYLLKDDSKGRGATSSSDSSDPSSGTIGFVLILINLIMDGFTNSTQDELVRSRHWSSTELMVWANAASTVWLLAVSAALETMEVPLTQLIYSLHAVLPSDVVARVAAPSEVISHLFVFHDMSRSLAFLRTHRDALKDLVVMSAMNALGQVFIFRTIASFGGLALTGMTLVRKAGSIILSIVIHGHVLNNAQQVALAAILAGVIWDGWLNISSRGSQRKSSARGKVANAASRGKPTSSTSSAKVHSQPSNKGGQQTKPKRADGKKNAKTSSGGHHKLPSSHAAKKKKTA